MTPQKTIFYVKDRAAYGPFEDEQHRSAGPQVVTWDYIESHDIEDPLLTLSPLTRVSEPRNGGSRLGVNRILTTPAYPPPAFVVPPQRPVESRPDLHGALNEDDVPAPNLPYVYKHPTTRATIILKSMMNIAIAAVLHPGRAAILDKATGTVDWVDKGQ